ncbi:MAG: PAS domain S-box protein [Deltaproteobacteria bacterium]|nr:PAS domain S-box protein [Deltaproteobacteria bacterium]
MEALGRQIEGADIDRLQVGVVVHGADDEIVYVNACAARLLGRADVVGRRNDDPAWDVIFADGTPCLPDQRPVEVARRTRADVADVILGVRNEHGRTWLMVSAAPVIDAADRIARVVVTLIDISTEHERLRASEQLQASMVRAMAEGVALHRPSGEIEYVNPAAERILGLTLAQLQGREAIDPRWRLTHLDGTALPGEDIPSEITSRTGQPCMRRLGVQRANGEQAWLQVSTDPVGAPVDGRHAVVATFTDVTVERDTMVALQESRALLQQVTEAVPGVLIQGELRADGHLVIGYVSSGARDHLGRRPEDLIGDLGQLLSGIHPDDAARVRAELALQAARGASAFDQIVRMTETARSLRIRALARPAGGRTIWTGVVLDVTEERRLEQQVQIAQRREAIGAVTAGIAHNFNNALAVILPALSELRDVVADEHRALVDDGVGAARSAMELVKRLMTVVRGATAEPPESFDVVELVREAVAMAQQLFRGAVELAPEIRVRSAPVRGNRAGLQQVLLNLFINARDALAGRAHARIGIEVIAAETIGLPQIEVRVRDNGCGISEENLRHLGEPFFTTKAPNAGTGLGLATAFATVRGFGGQLTCASTLGVGTEFTLRLPLRPADATAAPAPAPARTARGRILVIDDDAAVRRVVRVILERRGFTAVEAASGDAAIAVVAASETPFDVAVLDLSLGGGVSGERVLDELRRDRPALPVVIMSGFVDAPERLTAAAAIVEKPVAPDALISLLTDIIERSRRLASDQAG